VCGDKILSKRIQLKQNTVVVYSRVGLSSMCGLLGDVVLLCYTHTKYSITEYPNMDMHMFENVGCTV